MFMESIYAYESYSRYNLIHDKYLIYFPTGTWLQTKISHFAFLQIEMEVTK